MAHLEDDAGFGEFIEPAQPGHNQPPDGGLQPAGEALKQKLERDHASIFKRALDLMAAENRMPATIETEGQDEEATSYVKQIQACEKELDALRIGAKAPYELAANSIHSMFRTLQDKLCRPSRNSPAALKERVQAKQTAYKIRVEEAERARREELARLARVAEDEARQRREEEDRRARAAEDARRAQAKAAEDKARQEREELEAVARRRRNEAARLEAEEQARQARIREQEAADRRRQEEEAAAIDRRAREDKARIDADKAAGERAAAEKLAAAPAATMSRARGQHGGISSLRTYWDFRDMDRAALDLETLRPYLATDALAAALRGYIKAGGRQIAGAVIEELKETSTR